MKKISVNFLGVKVNFETDIALLIKILEKYRLLCSNGHSAISPSDEPISIRSWSENNKFIVEDLRTKRYFFNDEKDAVIFCGSLFLGLCAGRLQPRFCMFHASAVSIRGEAFIFLGDSSAGKTTLALSLLKEGFELLCDDLSILDLNTRFILPLKIKIAIDQNSPFAVSFGPEMFDLSKIYVELEDVSGEGHWAGPARLKALFFLELGNGKSPRVERLTQYEGFRRLCPFYIYGEKDLKSIVEQNSKIARNTTSYLLRRGGIDETVSLVRKTLSGETRC